MKKILTLFLILAAMVNARADIQEFSSLEWVVDHSPAIGVYEVVFPGTRDTPESAQYGLKLQLLEPLKGKPPKMAQTPGKEPYHSTALIEMGRRKSGVQAGDLFLVFFSPGEPADFISIAQGNTDSVIDARIQLLTDPVAILAVVRDRIAHSPPGKGEIIAVARGSSFDKNFVVLPFSLLSVEDAAGVQVPDDLLARAIAKRDLLGIASSLRNYYYNMHVIPAGGNAAIIATLIKERAYSTLDFDPKLNAAGEACDPWGMPYRIDVSNPKFPWAYSFGPDKKDDGGAPDSDDVTSW